MNKIFFTLTLCFLCSVFLSMAQNSNKSIIYVTKFVDVEYRRFSDKYNFINVDKDPEVYDNKKKIKSLNSYLREKVDLSQIDYDSICGNLFEMSFTISTTGKIEKMHIISGVTSKINNEIENMLKSFVYKPGIKNGVAVSVSYRLYIQLYDIARPESYNKMNCGTWLPEIQFQLWNPQSIKMSPYRAAWAYVSRNIKYPDVPKKDRKKGRVIVRFNINKTGKVEDIKIIQSLGSMYDQAVIDVINTMPEWLPANKNGEIIDYWYSMPVSFRK